MNTADDQPPLPALGLGFEAVRYEKRSISSDSLIIVHRIGIYHTFAIAQAAAQNDLQRTLVDYLRRGYYGRYFNDIDLKQRGLITAYHESLVDGYMLNREITVSEFRLATINVWDNTWEVETRLLGEELSFGNPRGGIISNMQETGMTMPTVRLPVKPELYKEPSTPEHIVKRGEYVVMPEPAPTSPQFPPLGVQYDEERQPEWSRTRIPYFDRRDDGPFRRPGDTPYAQVMTFSPPAPTLLTHSGSPNSEGTFGEAAATA
jgi:hypothetical protein